MADLPSISSLVDTVRRTGLFDPRRGVALTLALTRWGPTLAASVAAAATTTPSRTAVVDDRGSTSFAELDRSSSKLAEGLRSLGLERGDQLGVACRNHREFVEVTLAAAKAGLAVVYLNTGFSGPQLLDVARREGIDALVIDADLLASMEFDRDVDSLSVPVVVVPVDLVPVDAAIPRAARRLDEVRASTQRFALTPSRPLAPILLTSGTTGTPKGARRNGGFDASAALGIVQEIPYRSDDVIAITSPLFHAWGLAQLGIALSLGATVVVSSSFDAAATLEQVERVGATVLAVVPVILQRLLAEPSLDSTDLSSLRIVASSGSALPEPVVVDWLTRVGPNLYNLYGSTEVGQATLAVPAELVAEPRTAGHVLPGAVVEILDDAGERVAAGGVGRIFVGGGAQFDGYTGGGGKEVVDGLMSTGDVGYFDAHGLLYVTGRADDMIVSGAENVFPQEVEDLLLAHPAIVDVAVVGVDDEEFGQRLVAHVVRAPGAKISAAQVRRLVAEHLARHKVPRDVTFVAEIPRTLTGKVRRASLSADS